MSNLNPGGLTRVLNYVKTWVTGLLNDKANSSHSHTKSQITDFPTIPSKTSQLTNDSGFLTSHQSLSNYSTLVNTVKSLSISGKTITVTPGSGNAYTLTTQDTNTTYSNFVKSGSGAAAGLVPAPSTTAGTTKYLREDGTWQVPPDHTYTVNNATLTIQKNGTTVNSFTANASSNVTANITVPTKTSELTNNSGYITSSSNITGNAATATKLATARSISAGDLEFQGSANFDGSGNIKLNITHHRSLVTIGNKNNYPFHRIAYTAQETGNWLDRVITFFIGREYSGGGYGICRIVLRTNDAASGATASCVVQWLVRTADIPVDTIQVGFNNTAAASYIDVFYKSDGGWGSAICRVISHASSRTNVGQGFTVVSTSSEVDNTTASNPLTSTESYATIAAAGTKIRGKAYTSTITASDAGSVNYANSAGAVAWGNVSGKPSTYTPSSHTHDDRYYTESEINTLLLSKVYPVGAIYLSVNSVNPGTLFGGTWEKIKDKFLLSSGDTYSIGSTGGNSSTTLKIANLPSHKHTGTTGNESQGHTHSGTTGNQSAGHTHSYSGTTDSDGRHFHKSGHGWHNLAAGSDRHCISNSMINGDDWSENITGYAGAHTHTFSGTTGGISANHNHSFTTGGVSANHTHSFTTSSVGSAESFSNMPPYLAINVWKRVA